MMEDAIQFMELQERVSKNGSGRRYFTGDLNSCRVVAFQNDDVMPDEGAWSVFIQPGKAGRWKHTEKGKASAEARISKARQHSVKVIKEITDDDR